MIHAYPIPVAGSNNHQFAQVRLQNGNGCCGMWELVVGFYNQSVTYDSDALKKFRAELVKMAKTAACTGLPGQPGVKGAGIVMVNLVVEDDEEDAEVQLSQTKLIPLITELGFRRVKTYYNPRSKNTLRMYYITGAELYAALVK